MYVKATIIILLYVFQEIFDNTNNSKVNRSLYSNTKVKINHMKRTSGQTRA